MKPRIRYNWWLGWGVTTNVFSNEVLQFVTRLRELNPCRSAWDKTRANPYKP